MQQPLQANPENLITARSPLLYSQSSSMSPFQHHNAIHGQMGMNAGGNNGLHMMYGDTGMMGGSGGGGTLATGGFSDFSRVRSVAKPDMGGSADGRGGQLGDGTEPLYMKGSDDRSH